MTPQNRRLVVSVAVGVLYGAIARVFFGYKLPWESVFTVMSVSFLFLVPLVLGFLVVYVGEREGPPWGWWRWIEPCRGTVPGESRIWPGASKRR